MDQGQSIKAVMNRVVPIIFLLIALSVCGEERLSVIRPGIPCKNIPDIERQLGSVELNRDSSGVLIEYSGIQGGKEARIIYRCDGGRLTEQRVMVMLAGRDEAYRYADAQKTALSERLGDPIHDGLQLPVWRRLLFGFLGADLDYLTAVVVWGRESEAFMLSVTQAGESLWQVSISQGSSKLEYIINS